MSSSKTDHSKGERASIAGSALPALGSGAVQSVIFNPIDRALFLRVHHLRSFFHPDNWSNPFQGFANAAFYRTLCSASYLFWQDFTKAEVHRRWGRDALSPSTMQMCVGAMAGTCNGSLLNALQIVKYRAWSDGNGTFWNVSRKMLHDAGWRIFFRGVKVSIARDSVFGVTYELLRAPHRTVDRGMTVQFLVNLTAAVIACVISSPLNYCRNIVYAAPPQGCPLRVHHLLVFMVRDAMTKPSLAAAFTHINVRLNVGWGSVRVGLGMAVGQMLFRVFQPTK